MRRAAVLVACVALPCLARAGEGDGRAKGGHAVVAAVDRLDAFLAADITPADGFDLPSPGGAMRALAAGRVIDARRRGGAWGGVVIVEHLYYENNEKHRVRAIHAHLDSVAVHAGDAVERGAVLGRVTASPDGAGRVHVELQRDADGPATLPEHAAARALDANDADFLRERGALPVPQREPTLVLVDTEGYRMRLYKKGRAVAEYRVAFGQARGRKRVQGDNRTPQGMYFVVAKQRGEFPGDYGEYFGGHWIKLNYPNAFDAAWGRANDVVTGEQARSIAAAWRRRAATLQSTGLGGGIGFHGWAEEWDDDGPRHLSWGCIVVHLRDVAAFYDSVPAGTMVVVL